MSCGLQATSPPKRRQFTPDSLASGMDCLCASQKSVPGERNVHAAHPVKDEERQLADFSLRAAVSITNPWLEPSELMTPSHLSMADRLLKLRYPATCVNCGADLCSYPDRIRPNSGRTLEGETPRMVGSSG
jgi:hypothetical protein